MSGQQGGKEGGKNWALGIDIYALMLLLLLGSLLPLERNTDFLDKSLDEVYLPCSASRAIPSSPWQLEWRLDFPGATREAPGVPRQTLRILLQLEKDLEIPSSMRLEARFPYRDSRAMPCSPSQLEWRLNFPGVT